MTHEKEETIMGWMLIAMGILFIIAIANVTPTTTTQDTPCKHSH
mgnify:CR=1 FL=1